MLEDATFWALVGLVIFFGILVYMKVPAQVATALDSRGQAVRDELEQARRLREEAEALLAEFQRKAGDAEKEAASILDQAKREAEALGKEATKRMADYVASRTRMAEEKIGQAEAQALQEVRSLSADIAVGAAQRILTAKVKGEAAASLIGRAIGDVKAKLH
jgi:F-type H+-transporting ATPase subunit b